MILRYLFAAAFAAHIAIASATGADPVVSNVQGLQRPGTKLEDISYDVTADTPTVAVTLRSSSDGGATFDVPATTLSGINLQAFSYGASSAGTSSANHRVHFLNPVV
jgi:hypothetical protein